MNLFYETHGSGAPLVLIPGFASGAWTWYRQIEELARNFRVVVFDPRGIGRSLSGGGKDELRGLSMETFVEDVLRILDELKIRRAHVLGASFGGFVAQEFALRFPERLEKLILACTTSGGARHVRPTEEILRSFAPDPRLPMGEKIRKFFRPAFTAAFHRDFPGEVEKVCLLRERHEVAETAYLAQLEAAFSFNTEARVAEIRHETLVLTGDCDLIVPMENSVNLAARLPRATLEIIENGSHMFFIENYREFNQSVLNFLQS